MIDLTQEEREALLRTRDEIMNGQYDETAPSGDADFIAWFIEQFLRAVPRLREVEGGGKKYHEMPYVVGRTMRLSLQDEIQDALNRHSAENASDTPDFVLAQFLVGCLAAWNEAVRERERWYGRAPRRHPGGGGQDA